MCKIRAAALFAVVFLISSADVGAQAPRLEIANSELRVGIYLPDAEKGFYRGTRFDWSGVISALEYAGHNYYGPWFTKTDPHVRDFVYDGPEIVAGPCSAITGPVEEFSWKSKALGFDEAKAGGRFLKIGVGMLGRPDAEEYTPYRLYDIVDGGKWSTRSGPDFVEFTQDLNDADTGFGYQYVKTIRLAKGKPEMSIEHRLHNTGRRVILTSVYDHNFLVLDHRPTGPEFHIRMPFSLAGNPVPDQRLASIRGNELFFNQTFEGKDTFSIPFSGFGETARDYNVNVENAKVGAGFRVVGDRPLSKVALWSIRSVISVEPFIDMSIEPGAEFTWNYHYAYYTILSNK